MEKLKEKIYNSCSMFKKTIEVFPLTIATILILTVIYAVNIGNYLIWKTTLEYITLFGIIFASSTFLIETIFEDKIKNKIIFYIIAAIIAVLLTCANQIINASMIPCYMISAIVLSIYYNYKKSQKTFEEYVTSFFVNAFKSSIIYGILSIGLLLVTAIFIYLILDGSSYDLIARIEILILGIYYIPAIIQSFYKVEEKTGKFAKNIIRYVLGILVMAAFAIIYMYVIKIIVLRDMPSNQIFRILAALFIIGCPIWTMIMSFKEEKILDKINKLLPILFIPFIILQIYSIGARILSNGLTESRYLCIMLIIFEIIYTAMYLKNKEKIENVLLSIIVLAVISTIVPYANMHTASNLRQYNNLKIYKEKTEYTDEEIDKICGAYYYLKSSVQGEKYINKLLTETEQDQVKKLRTEKQNGYTYENDKKYVSANADIEYIDVNDYQKLYAIKLSKYYYGDEQKTIEEIFNNLEITTNGKHIVNANLLSKVNEYIKNEEQLADNFENINEIQIDTNLKMIITSFYISYNEISKDVINYRINGYLLEK